LFGDIFILEDVEKWRESHFVVEIQLVSRKHAKRPGDYAYLKHPVLLLPSGPDKVWALGSRRSGSTLA